MVSSPISKCHNFAAKLRMANLKTALTFVANLQATPPVDGSKIYKLQFLKNLRIWTGVEITFIALLSNHFISLVTSAQHSSFEL